MSRERQAVDTARRAFLTGRSIPLEHRIHQLKSLQRFLVERQKDIALALKKDLHKVGNSSGQFGFDLSLLPELDLKPTGVHMGLVQYLPFLLQHLFLI